MKTKRNHNNDEYVALMRKINEWQKKHPGEEYPRGWRNQLRQIAKRYAGRKQGEKE